MSASLKQRVTHVVAASKFHLTDHAKDPWSTKKKIVTSVWLISNCCLFPYFISAAVACGALETSKNGQAGFMLMWTFLNCCALFALGSWVLFRKSTEYYIGGLTAGCIVMCSWLLQEAIVLAHFSDPASGVADTSAVTAAMVFGFFLFLGYLVTAIMLIMYSGQIAQGSFSTLQEEHIGDGETIPHQDLGAAATSTLEINIDEDGTSV